MRVLVACEYSGTVRDAFRERGHDAWSCDILPTDVPGPHIQGDVLEVLNDGWDLMIAFPPCTHLAVSGARHFAQKRADGRQQQGIGLFMSIANAPINKIAIENPVGIMSSVWRPPDQIIQPYYFGDEAQKTTCLWLKNLPLLFHLPPTPLFASEATWVDKGEIVTFKSGKRMARWLAETWGDGHARSKTFSGIARAMAEQWG